MASARPRSTSGIIAAFAIFALLITCVYSACEWDEVEHEQWEMGNNCFKFLDNQVESFNDAQASCEAIDANLASIRSGVMNDFVQGFMQTMQSDTGHWWTGYNRNQDDESWYWVDGHPGLTEFWATPSLTFEEASEYCRTEGGELASIHSVTEESEARRFCPCMPCWIGLRRDLDADDNVVSDWYWLDGTDFTYDHWIGTPSASKPYAALWSNCGWYATYARHCSFIEWLAGDDCSGSQRKYHGVCRRAANLYENFDTGQGQLDTGNNCVAMSESTGTWYDKKCNEEHGFVCSKPSSECHDESMTRLYAKSGYISDGALSDPYDPSHKCTWIIDPPGDAKVEITIDHFVTEENYDFLYVYDGTGANNDKLIKACHGGMNAWHPRTCTCLPGEVLTSTETTMTLVWKTDYCVQSEGWGLFYKAVGYNPCSICATDAMCLNDVCECKEGFNGNGEACSDDDECSAGHVSAPNGQHTCDINAVCKNTHGSFECTCMSGWESRPGTDNDDDRGTTGNCIDIHECEKGTAGCATHATCENLDGSYDCECNEGYDGDGFECEDVHECNLGTDDCDDTNGGCTNEEGTFTCTCKAGWKLNADGKTCENVDECASGGGNDCSSAATCTDTDGSFDCACRSGYTDQLTDGFEGVTCINDNECELSSPCPANSNCQDTPGAYKCTCNSGFEDSNGGANAKVPACVDIDECLSDNPCAADADGGICVNAIGGEVTCRCKAGYVCDPAFTDCTRCMNVDECANSNDNNCDPVNADCTDNVPGYTCTCNRGWEGNPENCDDVNECNQANECNKDSKCINSGGSYSCACNEGYTGDGWGVNGCQNANEPSMGSCLCHSEATCIDTDPATDVVPPIGYDCECNAGYTGNGLDAPPPAPAGCRNVNECMTSNPLHNCHENAKCTDADPGFSCACNAGYDGNGTHCEDVDECAGEGSGHKCDTNAECINLGGDEGKYKCNCNDGYYGTGGKDECSNVVECNSPVLNSCDSEHGICADTMGSFECACGDGWALSVIDNRTCDNVNECDLGYNCSGAAECVDGEGSFQCSCYGTLVGDGPCKARCSEEAAKLCHQLAICEDEQCICQTGLIGDGLVSGSGCSTDACAVRFSILLPSSTSPRVVNGKLKDWDFQRESYLALFDNENLTLPTGFADTMHHEVLDTETDDLVIVLNALFFDCIEAAKWRDVLEGKLQEEEKPTCFNVELTPDNYPLEPRIYRWVAPTSAAAVQIAPTGMSVERVQFAPGCGQAGCWAVDVIYSTGTDTFNTFFIPHAVGDESVPDFNYDVSQSSSTLWTTSPLATFNPNNHPCRSFDYVPDPSTPIPTAVTACCIPEFLGLYRTTEEFTRHLESFVVEPCLDDDEIPLFMPGKDYILRENATYAAKPVDHLEGVFRGLTHSRVDFTGIIDPFIRQYTATFYLDDIELRQKAGILRGTVGVEYTIDTFVGLANFKPTGIEFLDPFATQVQLHLERTQFFAVSTHGTNEYTFLEYVNMRLVVVYNQDTNLQNTPDTSRTDASGAAHYVQVTFTLGPQYQPQPETGLIPLDSVTVGQGAFLSNPFTDNTRTTPGLFDACQQWADAEFPDLSTFLERIPIPSTRASQQCAPLAQMCVSPTSLPDQFVSFNVPLGIDWLPPTTADLSENVFVQLVVSAIDTGAQNAGTVPNSGEGAQQMKTTLSASIPVVEGGMSIFCDGIIAKTDLKAVADVDLVIGTASSLDELTRLSIYKNIGSSGLSPTNSTFLDTSSIESGFMTLVVKGNASYFGRNGGAGAFGLQLEDVITIHIMEDDSSPVKVPAVKALIASPGEDNFDVNDALRGAGYALNGAFEVSIDAVAGRASLHPSSELLKVCSFRPPRPTFADAFPATCIVRRDVEARGFPEVGFSPSTATEVWPLRNSPTGSEVTADDPLRGDNGEFMKRVLGNNDFARTTGMKFSHTIASLYQTNGQYIRAWWVNPGYEWTPQQTGEQSIFTISQKVFLFALVGIDEGFGQSRRRMLLQSATGDDRVADSESGLAGMEVDFDMTRFTMLSQAFEVPVELVSLFSVEMTLSDFQACMPAEDLRPELRTKLEAAMQAAGVSTPFETIQIAAMEVQRRGLECGSAAPERRLLQNAAAARVDMLVVFAEPEDGDLSKVQMDLDRFGANDASITGIQAQVVSEQISVGEVTETPAPQASTTDNSTLMIAAVCGGIGGLLLCLGVAGFLMQRAARNPPAVVADQAALVGDVSFDKARLMAEATGTGKAEARAASLEVDPVATAPTPARIAEAVPTVAAGAPPAGLPYLSAPMTLPPGVDFIPFTHPGYANVEAPAAAIPTPTHIPLPPRGSDDPVFLAPTPATVQRKVGASGLPPPPADGGDGAL